ncbi:hypothetical protein JHD50_00705 [Sulfurimonas sp. MAG313]|nr:hypothetical protein [Sulfurimonas sp. MAG313]MDF1879833.1 hypothetical protein [Sulfurimonas sp. MAG313]
MGVPFSFYNFTALVDLQRGIVERQDDSRREAFCILYCNFDGFDKAKVDESLKQVVRSSDSYVHHDNAYFFILYQTDKYGASVVATMFEEFFGKYIHNDIVSYPRDGESAQDLFNALQTSVKKKLNVYLECLDKSSREKPIS